MKKGSKYSQKMLSRIRPLDSALVNRIAAGEVINGPINVVKELIENSIDACSTKIDVSITSNGYGSIKISDNGCGISAEDLPIACRKHTTSKISEFNDLSKICTFGFRGEALFSCTVHAHVTIRTKTKNDSFASVGHFDYGELTSPITQIAGNVGTTIEVKELFYNMPLRRQSNKGVSEVRGIKDMLQKYAVINPRISFSLTSNGTELFHTHGNTTIDGVLSLLYDVNTSAQYLRVSTEIFPKVFAEVWLSSPRTQLKKSVDAVFINGRLVSCDALKNTIQNIYGNNKVGFMFCMMTMPQENVDVNVHPSKKKVCFLNEKEIIDKVAEKVSLLVNNQPNSGLTTNTKKTKKAAQLIKGQSSLDILFSLPKKEAKKIPALEPEVLPTPIISTLPQSLSISHESLSMNNEVTSIIESPPRLGKKITLVEPMPDDFTYVAYQQSQESKQSSQMSYEPNTSPFISTRTSQTPSVSIGSDIINDKKEKSVEPLLNLLPKQPLLITAITEQTPAPTPVRERETNKRNIGMQLNLTHIKNIEEKTESKPLRIIPISNTTKKHKPKSKAPSLNLFEELKYKPTSNIKNDVTAQSCETIEALLSKFKLPAKREVKLQSILELINDYEENSDVELTNMLRISTFVGSFGGRCMFKCNRLLIILNEFDVVSDFIRQKALSMFANYKQLKLQTSIALNEQTKSLEDRSAMLLDYFSISVHSGKMFSIPKVIDNFIPSQETINLFINRLTDVDYSEEKPCLSAIIDEISYLFAYNIPKNILATISEDMITNYKPHSSLSTCGKVFIKEL